MGTYELAILAGLNVSSIFVSLWILKILDRRRKYKLGRAILEDMGEKAETDMNFMQIIQQNFGFGPNNKRDDE